MDDGKRESGVDATPRWSDLYWIVSTDVAHSRNSEQLIQKYVTLDAIRMCCNVPHILSWIWATCFCATILKPQVYH